MGMMVMSNIIRGIQFFFEAIQLIIVGYCLGSWFLSPNNRLYVLLQRFSDPFIAPFRPLAWKLMARTGLRIDLSAIISLFVLRMLNSFLVRFLVFLMGMFSW